MEEGSKVQPTVSRSPGFYISTWGLAVVNLMAAAGLLLPVRHKPAALDPDAWKSPRWTPTDADLDTTSTPVHSQALLGRGGHSRSPSPRPSQSDFGLDVSAARSSNVYGGNSG
ncbi:hypothetical protein AK812_SmicGene3409 [Symbiodinium microadriaticum]|uniref:Uncharacterized protein n=1 Tax=Symbiodinium microadriaticum TaxID=2951 RepID=A0A1Q9EYV8_SYMMI|nr:hypothetical protein AK812_SmicGene3409 [Symbiodinium microadriaticum]